MPVAAFNLDTISLPFLASRMAEVAQALKATTLWVLIINEYACIASRSRL